MTTQCPTCDHLAWPQTRNRWATRVYRTLTAAALAIWLAPAFWWTAAAPAQAQNTDTMADVKALPVVQQDRPATVRLIIGIDVSAGSPFLSDRAFARKTARRITDRIARLPRGAVLSLRTFGAPAGDDKLEIDRRIIRRKNATDAANLLDAIIAGMPQLAEGGKIEPADQSNIIGFLETVSRRVDCGLERTIIILATDGFEQSEYADLGGGGSLPSPASPFFEGCARLEMLGLGRGGRSPRLTNEVVKAWTAWAQAAGFTVFLGLDDW